MLIFFLALVLIGGALCIYWEKNTQNKEPVIIEEASVLHLMRDKFHRDTTREEVEAALAALTPVSRQSSAASTLYNAPYLSLNGRRGKYLQVNYSTEHEEKHLKCITWMYGKSDPEVYLELVKYLNGMLGKPKSQKKAPDGSMSAEWPACRLECDNSRLDFIRLFD